MLVMCFFVLLPVQRVLFHTSMGGKALADLCLTELMLQIPQRCSLSTQVSPQPLSSFTLESQLSQGSLQISS